MKTKKKKRQSTQQIGKRTTRIGQKENNRLDKTVHRLVNQNWWVSKALIGWQSRSYYLFKPRSMPRSNHRDRRRRKCGKKTCSHANRDEVSQTHIDMTENIDICLMQQIFWNIAEF